jgi:hypothetical protein
MEVVFRGQRLTSFRVVCTRVQTTFANFPNPIKLEPLRIFIIRELFPLMSDEIRSFSPLCLNFQIVRVENTRDFPSTIPDFIRVRSLDR